MSVFKNSTWRLRFSAASLTLFIVPVLAILILPELRSRASGLVPSYLPLGFQRLFSSCAVGMPRAPVIALSHGGGPLPLLGDPGHKDIVRSLTQRVPALLKLGTDKAPRAIVVVTAHWSEKNPRISNGPRHNLLYDYYNFPKESYELKYPAPGSPDIANEVASALREEGLKPELDEVRGWDHGVFVPMLLIDPAAKMPIVQLSVLESEDPTDHYAMGRALSKLRDSNVAIVGSGFASIHNLQTMRDGTMGTPGFVTRNKDWSRALGDAVFEEDPSVREKKLAGWRSFPYSYEMHPKNGGEHFMPLLVAAGAGGQGKAGSYIDMMRGIEIWSYYWE